MEHETENEFGTREHIITELAFQVFWGGDDPLKVAHQCAEICESEALAQRYIEVATDYHNLIISTSEELHDVLKAHVTNKLRTFPTTTN